jgi:hypothetical protein
MKPRPYKSISPSRVLLIRQIIVGVMIAAFLGMLITSVWYLTRLDAFTISKVTVIGGETIPHEQIEAIVHSKLDGAYLKIVPHTFAFTYPEKDITNSIKEIERIKDLTVVRSGTNEIVVTFDEYIPHTLWCKNDDNEGCFFLDDAGYSFASAPTLSGGSFLRLVTIGKDPAVHTQAFDTDQYKAAQDLVNALGVAKWPISKAEIDAAGDGFLTVVGGGEFKITLKQSAKETVNNLLTVLGSEKFTHIKPGNFEYVDLRFGSKVFVNETTIQAGSASSTAAVNAGAGFAKASSTPAVPVAIKKATSTPTAEPAATSTIH